jgi:hypothetical protein
MDRTRLPLLIAAFLMLGGIWRTPNIRHNRSGMPGLAGSTFQSNETAASNIKGLPFLTFGPSGSGAQYTYNGTDAGVTLNAMGAALKAGNGGTIQIFGGIGQSYLITTPVIFYNSVNYIGDNATLKNTNLLNPFTTDTTNAYYSGVIQSLNLDGNNVAGVTCFTVLSAHRSLFQDIQVQNCNAAPTTVTVTGSPFTWTNPSGTVGAYVKYYDDATSTTTAIVVNSVSQTISSAVGNPYGTFYVPPSATIVVTYTTTLTNPHMFVCNGIGWNLAVSTSLTGIPFGINQYVNSQNSFVDCCAETCSIGMLWTGHVTPRYSVTDNTFIGFSQHNSNFVGLLALNTTDSNTMVQTVLQTSGTGSVGFLYNALDPTTNQTNYDDRCFALSVDPGTGMTNCIGVMVNACATPGLMIDPYEPDPTIPFPYVVNYGPGHGGKVYSYLRDVQNRQTYAASGSYGSGTLSAALAFSKGMIAIAFSSGVANVNLTQRPLIWIVKGGLVTAIAINGQDCNVTATTWTTIPYFIVTIGLGDSLTVTTSSGNPGFYGATMI